MAFIALESFGVHVRGCCERKWEHSILELSVFLYHTIDLTNNHGMPVTSSGPSPLCSSLIYDPFRRYEVILLYFMMRRIHFQTGGCWMYGLGLIIFARAQPTTSG